MVSVSVVIPCKDDAELLARCLRSLQRQSRQPLEVVVVDNNSRDDTADVARAHGARVVTEGRPGIPAAASAGYDVARGDVIARCDADSMPSPDWLERLASWFEQDEGLAAVTGPGEFYELGPVTGRILGALYLWPFLLMTGLALAHWPLYGSNMAMRREVWESVRSSVHRADPEMHDDMDLSLHLHPAHRVRLDTRLRVGVSPRAVQNVAIYSRRFRRAVHTLAVHWPEQAPWRRWRRRFRVAR